MKQTRKGKNVEKLIRSGMSLNKIVQKGYSPSTVRYYRRKIFDFKKFQEDMEKIKEYNRKRYGRKNTNNR